jgi:hypothetical protein
MLLEKLSAEEQAELQKEKLLLLSRAIVAPTLERHAAVARLRTVHHLSESQIYSQIGAASSLCRLEENQQILLQLSATVQKLVQDEARRFEENHAVLLQLNTAVGKLVQDTDAEAVAFRKSWLFRLWRFFYGGQS